MDPLAAPLPPYARLLDLRVVEGAGDDRSRGQVIMPFSDDVVGRPGFLHGGAIAGVLEFAAFSALSRALGTHAAGEAGGGATTMKPISVTIDYMRGGVEALGDVHAEARIERLGKRIANVEAIAWQADRAKPIAAARINFLLERDA